MWALILSSGTMLHSLIYFPANPGFLVVNDRIKRVPHFAPRCSATVVTVMWVHCKNCSPNHISCLIHWKKHQARLYWELGFMQIFGGGAGIDWSGTIIKMVLGLWAECPFSQLYAVHANTAKIKVGRKFVNDMEFKTRYRRSRLGYWRRMQN